MTNQQNTRRQFLAASSATAFAAMAGCMDRVNSAIPNVNDGNGGDSSPNGNESNSGNDIDEIESPELTVETEYNSREKFKQPGKQLDDFENLEPWEVIRGSGEADQNITFDGSQSIRLSAKNSQNITLSRQIEKTDMSDLDVSMAVRTSTPSNIAIDIRLVDIYGGYAHHQLRSVTYGESDVDWFRTCPGVFEQSSMPLEREVVEEIQIIIYNTGDAEVWVDDLRTHKKPDKGYVILSWDDGTPDFYERASPLHDEYDVNAVQAAVRQWTRNQREGVMTVAQLKERQEAGDQIVAHGTHTRLAEMEENDLENALRRDKNWAVQNELEGGHFLVYPHNSFDKTVHDIASNYYYAGGFNQSGNVNLTGVHGFDPLALPRTIGSNLDIATRCIDLAAEHRQCTILNFHEFGINNTIDENEYEKLLQHINDTDNVEVINYDDLWKMRRAGH
ncbi:polysaccharide deacetylase [Natrinema sp. CBA1119]|uniref:polysaccharide deacetylase family protein n=1 Tax=Natrinema sp. CBA1119 TaxID=1608465 RepID=UPI000BF9B14D|nr:polysaccharide deacetylase family protein [Natrinema sp. CBA1119]PGF14460.1 polysaccharide deacetylase [Natrinema sp. CBA1119]